MKYFISITLLLLFLFTRGEAQSSAETFSSAMKSFNEKDYVEAHKLFDKFFTEHNEVDEIYATAKYYSGEALLNLGEKYAAKERYEYLCSNFKWSSFRDASLYKLGLIYLDLKQFEISRQRLNTLISEYPASEYFGSSLYWIGETYVEEGNIDNAISFLEEAVSKRKGNKYVDHSIYSLGYLHEKKGEYQKAVEYYDQLLSFHKDSKYSSLGQFRIGYCYFKLKDYNSSVIELNNPIISSLEPNAHSEALYLLANSHYRLSEYKNAENVFLENIRSYPASHLIRESNYGLAWSYFQQEKYNDAFEIFNALSKVEDSIGINSFYWKAESKRYAGKGNESLSILKEFMKKYPQSKLFSNAKHQIGGIYFSDDKLKESEKFLLESLSSDNQIIRSRSNVLLGDMNLNKQNFAAAYKNFKDALAAADSLSDIHSNALLGLGLSSYKLKQYNDAVRYFINLENKDAGFKTNKVNFYLAESHFAKGNFNEAVKRFSKVEKDDREFASLSQYGKSYSYFNLKDYENSILAFSDFIKRFPTNMRATDARLRLADSYYGNKNYTAAGKIYKEIFLTDEGKAKDPYVQYQYAQALYKGGNSSEAISQFRILQSNFPESEFADKSLYIVGWIFFQKNSFTDAVNSYRTFLTAYPKSSLAPMALYSIGDAFFNLSKYDSAIVNYQKVIDNYPNSNYVFDAVNGIQYCYVAQNQDDKAISLIDEFVGKNPGSSFADQIFFKKGELYYSQGAYEKAKTSYKEFLANYPKSELTAAAYYWIGKSAQNLQQYEEAVFNFNRVFESYPTNELAPASVIEIGNIYNLQKQFDLALAVYNKGIEKLSNSPQVAEILFMKATTLVNKGDISTAYEVYDEIVQYYGESVFAERSKFEIGLIEYSAKRYDNAIIYLRSISDSRTDEIGAKAQYYLGMALFDQGKTNDAISAFVRVRTVYSNYGEWLSRSTLMLGDCYRKLNDLTKAKQFYRDVIAKHRGDELGRTAQKKLREIE